MSGGHFDYIQFRLNDVIEELEEIITNNGKEYTEEELKEFYPFADSDYFDKYPYQKFRTKHEENVIEEFKRGLIAIKKANVYIQRIDWLLSGDDGEESFFERLKEDLNEI